jgi:aspartyl-tRNA(Asn)/glutamyl-tRNA(Gln) amidotransferase subunit C
MLNSFSMAISLDEVRHTAKLSRLELDESELMSLQAELNALLGHFSDIAESHSAQSNAGVLPATMVNVWREDVVGQGLTREAALRNSPVSKAGLFIVPMIIED